MVNALKILEVAGPIKSSNAVCFLFQQLQNLIWQRKNCVYVQHIRAHTGLPGPPSEGNNVMDLWTRKECIFLSSTLEKAKAFHRTFQVNAKALQQKFCLSQADVRQMVLDCPQCDSFAST